MFTTEPGSASRLVSDTVIYDSQGLLHADIDTISGGYNASHLDPVGYQGQSGNYTDLETQHQAAGIYTALSGPIGIYYDPSSGVGMARSAADALNTYDQLLHPFDGWTFGAYAKTAGEFGVGEVKGFGNYAAGLATLGFVSHPIAAYGQNEQAGAETLPVIADGVQYLDGIGELRLSARALEGGAAKVVAGATSKAILSPVINVIEKHNCFVVGTLVQMADGSTKPIEQINVGDLVKSRNPETGKIEAKRVDRTYVRVAPQVLTLSFTDAKTGQTEAFTCTPEHPFYVDGKGYVAAGQLGIGTSIVTRAGPTLALNQVNWNAPVGLPVGAGIVLDGQAHPSGITVYNLRVTDDHNYFVGTADGGTCVHNANYPINLEHIFHGEINASGKAVGFHHESSIGSIGKARTTAITGAENSQGVYRGTVEVFDKASGTWIAKVSQSTFFPKSWSRAKVLSEIRGAYANKGTMSGSDNSHP